MSVFVPFVPLLLTVPLHPAARKSEIFLLVQRLAALTGMSSRDINRLGDLHPTRKEIEEASPWPVYTW
jgi:hypothetical protein